VSAAQRDERPWKAEGSKPGDPQWGWPP
jgi:hypothetical protein